MSVSSNEVTQDLKQPTVEQVKPKSPEVSNVCAISNSNQIKLTDETLECNDDDNLNESSHNVDTKDPETVYIEVEVKPEPYYSDEETVDDPLCPKGGGGKAKGKEASFLVCCALRGIQYMF